MKTAERSGTMRKAPRISKDLRVLLATVAVAALVVGTVSGSAPRTPKSPSAEGAGQRPPGRVTANVGQDNRRTVPQEAGPAKNVPPAGINFDEMLSPGGASSTLKLMLLFTVLSVAPSILIMTTCFVRFVIVSGLLKQALGSPQVPPNQVVVALCLFLTFLVMGPVWKRAYEEGIRPYTAGEPLPEFQEGRETRLERAFHNTVRPLRKFMAAQIEATGNSDAVWMLLEYQRPKEGTQAAEDWQPPENYDEVPLHVLLPAFMLSELKTAFLIGFQIYLPFLVIDLIVSSVLVSVGMVMLPPVMVSLPLKLLLFVMIDGWYLTVGMLLESVQPVT